MRTDSRPPREMLVSETFKGRWQWKETSTTWQAARLCFISTVRSPARWYFSSCLINALCQTTDKLRKDIQSIMDAIFNRSRLLKRKPQSDRFNSTRSSWHRSHLDLHLTGEHMVVTSSLIAHRQVIYSLDDYLICHSHCPPRLRLVWVCLRALSWQTLSQTLLPSRQRLPRGQLL